MRVARRRVYYISGFDPRGPRFYHQLFQAEAQRQQAVDGCFYEVSGRRNAGRHATQWTVRSRSGDMQTETEHVFLRWDDLIRDHWPASRLTVLGRLFGFYGLFLRGGVLRRTWACARPIFWIYLLPLLYAVLSLLLAAGAASAAMALVRWLQGPSWVVAGAGVVAAAGLLIAALHRAEEARLFWLARIHVFMAHWGSTGPEPFGRRWREFAARIQSDLMSDSRQEAPDETLIVGHSVGAPAAIAVAHEWLALQPDSARPPGQVKLLTLGQVIPMLGLIPQANWFREQLRAVGASPVPWLDYTAPADPLCYALTESRSVCGLAQPGRADYRIKSARFDRMFPPAEYAKLRKDIFRIHFQYLMSTQLPVDNDYFKLTCGPHPLDVAALAITPPARYPSA